MKLYNALVVSLCATYTFVQGGHVRVDLFYAGAKFRTKKIVDMFGSIVFMLPMAVIIWMYGWYFLWRHLIVPKPSASDALDRLLAKCWVLKRKKLTGCRPGSPGQMTARHNCDCHRHRTLSYTHLTLTTKA